MIVAKVDGAEINLRQLNAMLAKTEGVTPENIGNIKHELLGNLVEQQLEVNLALSKKLDQKPEVANAIEASRLEILARAAQDQLTADLAAISESEARRFYAANPALYAERRVYTLQELKFNKPKEGISKLRALVATAKRFDDVAAWLNDNGVDFATSNSSLGAEQIASDVLDKLRTFKDGQIGVFEGQDGVSVTQLVASRPQPIPIAKALPSIVILLGNRRDAEVVRQAKLDMKSKANLEYLGEFAGGEDAFKSGKKISTESTDDIDAKSRAKAKAEAIVVEQGIKGL